MPFTKQGPYTVGGAFSSANANNIEVQYDEATLSFNNDMLLPFVLLGGVCTIHSGLPKQMDVTDCYYYATQPTDGTKRRRFGAATNFTTVTASATYFLDYNADGTASWGTAHSGVANYLSIARVTTDGSGNIAVITDARQLFINFWPSATGLLQFRGIQTAWLRSFGGGVNGTAVWVGTTDPGGNAGEGDLWARG